VNVRWRSNAYVKVDKGWREMSYRRKERTSGLFVETGSKEETDLGHSKAVLWNIGITAEGLGR